VHDRIREVWDAAAATGSEVHLGRRAAAAGQLDRLFAQLGDPAGDTCVEIGCGTGRMTAELVLRFPEVIAVDVSPAMIERAKAFVDAPNVRFLVTSDVLDGVPDESADVVICFGVLQHLPTRAHVQEMLREIARVLARDGDAFVQLPVLQDGAGARIWRLARGLQMRVGRRDFTDDPAYRGTRLTKAELARALAAAGLDVLRRADGVVDPTLYSRYTRADDTRLRLSRGR
jgi:ubiquinone/menaquinone biosynthesis C-methylase UbiE